MMGILIALSTWMSLIALFAVCSVRLDYSVGRDTYRTFGNGRFQLCHAHDANLMFCDLENSLFLSDANVTDWYEDGNLIYLRDRNGLFHIIEQDKAVDHTFSQFEQLDSGGQEVFKAMGTRNRFLRWLSDRNLTLAQWACAVLFVLIPIALVLKRRNKMI